MGLGKLYYFGAAFLAASFCLTSHWHYFDGSFHRPKNQAVKKKKKAEEAAAKAKKRANEVEREGKDRKSAHKAHRRRDDTPAPRASHSTARVKSHRRRSRAYDDGDGFGDDSSHSSSYAEQRSYRTNPSSRKHSSHRDFETRVKQNPYGDYVPEASVREQPTSSERHHQLSQCDPSTALCQAHPSVSQPTSTSQTTDTPANPHETPTTRSTNTSTAPTTTSFTLPSRDRELASESNHGEQPTPQLSSSVFHLRGALHKRRMSVSPEKFNKGHFEPLQIRTDIPLPVNEPPTKRTRTDKTEKKIEVYYDSLGTPKIKETPASIEAGFSPRTAVFSPDVMKNTPLLLPEHSEPPKGSIPSGHAIAASRLLNGPAPATLTDRPKAPAKKKRFSLLDAFVRNDALCMHLVSYLPMPSLIDLYAISKFFHWKFNKEATAFIMASVRTWAPNADQIFPWRCYASLCIKDPVFRQKSSAIQARGGADADYQQLAEGSRDVPSLRWLQMVVYRDLVATDMMVMLATKALRVDPKTATAIKRMWFLMDLPLNAHRIACIHSKTYITDDTLKIATAFFLKVDMAFTDPGYRLEHRNPNDPAQRFVGYVGCTLRQVLIAERSMTPLWRVLNGWAPIQPEPKPGEVAQFPIPLDEADAIELYWRHNGRVPPNTPANDAISSVTHQLLSPRPIAGYERVYRPEDDKFLTPATRATLIAKLGPEDQRYKPRALLTPVDLIMRECVRRELKQHEWWYDMMLFGFGGRDGRINGRKQPRTAEEFYGVAMRDFNEGQRYLIQRANEKDEERKAKRKTEEENKMLEEAMTEAEGKMEAVYDEMKGWSLVEMGDSGNGAEESGDGEIGGKMDGVDDEMGE